MTSDLRTITRSRGPAEGRKTSASKRFSCAAAGAAASAALVESESASARTARFMGFL
jgi:hypothetical protein